MSDRIQHFNLVKTGLVAATNEPLTSKNFERVFEVFIDSFSGATGGFFASLMLYPIENLRIRMQIL